MDATNVAAAAPDMIIAPSDRDVPPPLRRASDDGQRASPSLDVQPEAEAEPTSVATAAAGDASRAADVNISVADLDAAGCVALLTPAAAPAIAAGGESAVGGEGAEASKVEAAEAAEKSAAGGKRWDGGRPAELGHTARSAAEPAVGARGGPCAPPTGALAGGPL